MVRRLRVLEQGLNARVVEHPPMIVTSREGVPFVSALTHSGEQLQWSASETGEAELPVQLLSLLDRWAPDLAARYRRYRTAAPRVGKETCDLRFCTGPHIGPEVDNMTLRSRLERLEQCLPRAQKGPYRIIYTVIRPALDLKHRHASRASMQNG